MNQTLTEKIPSLKSYGQAKAGDVVLTGVELAFVRDYWTSHHWAVQGRRFQVSGYAVDNSIHGP